MKTLFERNLFNELAGHGLKIKALVWADELSEDVEEKEFQAAVHRNTKPNEKPRTNKTDNNKQRGPTSNSMENPNSAKNI